jgi:hypothetical protein
MKTIKDHYRPKTIYHFVYHELIMAARYKGVVTYQELAKLMGLPTTGGYMAHEIGYILGEISEDEVSYDRPMLSALAVSVKGKPSEGFFNLAKQLGRLQEDSNEAQLQFWEQEKQAVYETWKIEL